MRLIPFSSLVATPWKNGGGVTRQIACHPPGSSLDDFDWRISTAEVAQDGPFSRFTGVDRRLLILDGAGLAMRLAEGPRRVLTGEHIDFAGEAEVFGALIDGPVTDFNIMVRRERVRMEAEAMTVMGDAVITARWPTGLLFVLRGQISVEGTELSRWDSLMLDRPMTLRASGAAELLLIGFEALS
ncbi:HutD family protein [Aestuariivirga litoralis]|uniref:HutD family protein n=1 Tax=Aestuariivirga litoralis TaxID=2650924 RepID=A0A2W2BNA1_9HYPH|nr:HutD family protein [Aestuariivirga litoralis]PZF77729.1 HutD family protein [Aestuariivirga litoralis]